MVIDTKVHYREALQRLTAGFGPISADAERASGFRYGQRPFLIQLHRQGTGTLLLDPPALGDLSEISSIVGDELWLLHAASQDLDNLLSHGIVPKRLFDTELAAKLIGVERFGLAALLESYLDIKLEKKFSAVDWSTRPIPQEWLVYAALDVEYLFPLFEKLSEELVRLGRFDILLTESQHLLERFINPKPKKNVRDPWRKTSGVHKLTNSDQIAIVQELWFAREELAQLRDIAPGRLIPDRSIIAAATQNPSDFMALMNNRDFSGPASRTDAKVWWQAIKKAQRLKEKPELKIAQDGVPPIKVWSRLNPEAKSLLDAVRTKIFELAETLSIPHELLCPPTKLRTALWEKHFFVDEADLETHLRKHDFLDWQLGLILSTIWIAFVEHQQEEQDTV